MLKIADPIGPGVVTQVENGIQRATDQGAECLVILLDTPGGLVESMRVIVQNIMAAPICVVVYVAPAGARAASAGVMITIAADVAAMAPGTNIGAAHPVMAQGKEPEGAMNDKITNDMAAHARSLAQKRGRNVEWAEKAVRESVSITASEALENKVVDMVAADLDDLLTQLHGREINGKKPLDVEGAEIVVLNPGLRTRVLKAVSNPNVAYVLMMIGLAGLYFELSHPGAVFPGVVGGICLILAFFALQALPVNVTGILLIGLALILFLLEIKITSYGLLSVAGIISLALGSFMLFEDVPGLTLSVSVVLPTVLLVSGFFILVALLVIRAQTARPRTGKEGMVGEKGVAKTPIDPKGKVLVHGELWNARSRVAIEKDAGVYVLAIDGLVLEVAPDEGSET